MKTRHIILIVIVFIVAGVVAIPWLNGYQTTGSIKLAGLSAAGKVHRDEKNMPYIYADNVIDALYIQGFVTAQDRLFQMTLTKLFASGRMSELAGDSALAGDKKYRTIGLRRLAQQHANILNEQTRAQLQAYADGVNDFIAQGNDIPLEFALANIEPEPWTVSDSLMVLYLMSWESSANMKFELLSQAIINKVGVERFNQIAPFQTNPDYQTVAEFAVNKPASEAVSQLLLDDLSPWFAQNSAMAWGSNGWAVGTAKSPNGTPIVASDPHLNPSVLPGVFYPSALIYGDSRAVGVTIAGVPGILIGRNKYVAAGLTNAYGDGQDLYIEQVDPNNPNHYLEGEQSIAFTEVVETIRVKDHSTAEGYREEQHVIRSTKRGPVISDDLIANNMVISVRWAAAENMRSNIGLDALLKATSVSDIRKTLADATISYHNMTFADVEGNLGWQTTGRLPIRQQGFGNLPTMVRDSSDNWIGWIPYEEQPQSYSLERGWLGNANHYVVNPDYPYHYTNAAASRYRYERLTTLLDEPTIITPEQHWQYQRDDMNVLASNFVPVFVNALAAHSDAEYILPHLEAWDYQEKANSTASLLFNAIYRQLAKLVYQDELGETISKKMLGNWYYWQERLEQQVLQGESPWFDDITTPQQETLDDMIQQAATAAMAELRSKLGDDVSQWQWGQLHQAVFFNPVRRQGVGAELLGAKTYAMDGSGETLHRARFSFDKPFSVEFMASLRMVADLSDDDKVMAILAGGVTGRTFSPYMSDQLDDYFAGNVRYWWFSDTAIEQNTQSVLKLSP